MSRTGFRRRNRHDAFSCDERSQRVELGLKKSELSVFGGRSHAAAVRRGLHRIGKVDAFGFRRRFDFPFLLDRAVEGLASDGRNLVG